MPDGITADRLHIVDHPLVQHKLSLIRNEETGTKEFRELLEEIAMLMTYEVTRELPLKEIEIRTPVARCKTRVISGKKLGVVPILRAGLGMVDGIMKLIPAAKIGHLGMYRDPQSLEPVEYYAKLPTDVGERELIVLDPMLATGRTACSAIAYLKGKACASIKLVSLIASPEAVQRISKEHPDVDIYVASVDERLDEHGYIVPGLGDAGDRIFGTR